MNKEVLIIGGGVAGLSAACRLAELGIKPLVIESEDYPAHKICGEFFSPESLKALTNWNIFPQVISHARLHSAHTALHVPFTLPAGSLSHFQFDPLLRDYAVKKGGEVRVRTRVEKILPKGEKDSFHEVNLSSGETVLTANLIIAVGRLPQIATQPRRMPYIGFKAHFTNICLKDSLEMFAFPGAYLGILPVEEGRCNLACLAERKLIEEKGSIAECISFFASQNQTFKNVFLDGQSVFNDWMVASIPEFGYKKVPHWLDTYFIGDAACTIPPASGAGISLALASGILAAEYIKKGDAKGFKKAWVKQSRSALFWAKALHHVLLRPSMHPFLMKMGRAFPRAIPWAFHKTRLRS